MTTYNSLDKYCPLKVKKAGEKKHTKTTTTTTKMNKQQFTRNTHKETREQKEVN